MSHPINTRSSFDDGRVRLSVDELMSLSLQHVISGLDESTSRWTLPCGAPTALEGYTEWVGKGAQPVTLGWDWRVKFEFTMPRYVRIGHPFSNVLLVDQKGRDYRMTKNLCTLSSIVDALPWAPVTAAAVSARYV